LLPSSGATEPIPAGGDVIRVLLADDHEFVRRTLTDLLGATGDITVVAECRDGEEALAAAEERNHDVVILDLIMPRRTGLEAARELLSVQPEARVILLTGNLSAAAAREAWEIGLAGYLLKGDDPADLVQHVRTVAAGGTAWNPAALSRAMN
jgi:DNA-binding NarL/FixJ family response regulator